MEELRSMKLKESAKKVEDGIEETLTRESHRTRVVGSVPDDNFSLLLVCARLRHVAGPQ